MDVWQTLLLAFGGNAALLAVLGLLGKSFVEKLLLRDTKQFESNLKVKTDAEIERLKNELTRSIERYKVQLKKSEFLFQKEFEAASAFVALRQSIQPAFSNSTMDWHDACGEVAQNFEKIENLLNGYLAKFGAVLTDDARTLLLSAISDAGQGKFNIDGMEVTAAANAQAETLYNTVIALESTLIACVRDQSIA